MVGHRWRGHSMMNFFPKKKKENAVGRPTEECPIILFIETIVKGKRKLDQIKEEEYSYPSVN